MFQVSSPLICVVGARPNFMKMAAVLPALKSGGRPLDTRLVHTGQHYDAAMKSSFFRQLDIPEPDVDLGVGSGSHAVQTAEIMRRFEPIIDSEKPCAVLVVGDVNSTIACALVAVKKGVPVIHVEAGLRSGDRAMPEEINRILTDQLSDFLFTTERVALDHLTREGIAAEKIHFVGNVMIDTLLRLLPHSPEPADTLAKLAPESVLIGEPGSYGLLTLHRPSNVDVVEVLQSLLRALADISQEIPLIFPVHPRTLGQINKAGLQPLLADSKILLLPPIGYLEMLGLMKRARLVLTDSGGIQEETTALGIPCVTLRENTERPITLTQGTNTLVGIDVVKIRQTVMDTLQTGGKSGRIPELWDGQAAVRIAEILQGRFAHVCAR
ncbi:MAG: UDP-N-acetylglucosamine 2-epimerase (non-hydrolyzing) [Magnetococcales bacterium]|nr:UDP-N-acetylglucosamine 2-epimerase (non-hydrolyzing) [Magnetococcales bacterium]